MKPHFGTAEELEDRLAEVVVEFGLAKIAAWTDDGCLEVREPDPIQDSELKTHVRNRNAW